MSKIIRSLLFVLFAIWTVYVCADSKTIVITESALPYQSQTWFFNTDEGEIGKAIKKSWDEGRRITSGAYTDKGWFLTMAKNTTISMQTYSLSGDWPSSWIENNWKGNYYITTISYSGSKWLVVMSQDSRFSHQTWRRDSWPNLEKWIKSNWDAGYRITEAAHNGTYWTIVMSKTNFIGEQSYIFTSGDVNKNINEAWNAGYRIQLLNHGGGQFFLVNCKYLENNGRSQGCNTQVTNIQQYISEKWAVPENIAYIGGGDNSVQNPAPQQNNSYSQNVPTRNYFPTGGYVEYTPQANGGMMTKTVIPCNVCHGSTVCTSCHGAGGRWGAAYGGTWYPCPVCGGDGKNHCRVCQGKGEVVTISYIDKNMNGVGIGSNGTVSQSSPAGTVVSTPYGTKVYPSGDKNNSSSNEKSSSGNDYVEQIEYTPCYTGDCPDEWCEKCKKWGRPHVHIKKRVH